MDSHDGHRGKGRVLRQVRLLSALAVVLSTATAGFPAWMAARQPAAAGTAHGSPATRSPLSTTLHGLPSTRHGEAIAGAAPAAAERISSPVPTPIRFSMLAFTLPPGASARYRTSADGRSWSPWSQARTFSQAGELPADDPNASRTEALWAGQAGWLQIAVEGGDPGAVQVHLIDSSGLNDSPPSPGPAVARDTAGAAPGAQVALPASVLPAAMLSAIAPPQIVSRETWGAGPSGTPEYAAGVKAGVLHHTAGGNDYSCADSAAIVRGIWAYHTQTLGWKDIGYNFLVDKCGAIFEGRAGGVDRPVIGAHTAGFNTGTFGVALLGEFGSQSPPAVALDALTDLLAWKLSLHGIDPLGSASFVSGGTDLYAAGTTAVLPTLFGHRDVWSTECPGQRLYDALPALRSRVRDRLARSTAQPPPLQSWVTRLDAADPVGLSTAVSAATFASGGALHAVVATASDFADAATAGPLAGRDGPVLLTAGDRLDQRVAGELGRVLPAGRTVYLAGGRVALGDEVEHALAQRWNVVRLWGEDRTGTAAAVAREVVRLRGRRVALVARAAGGVAPWADALAGGAYGARHATPVLLTWTDTLPPATAAAIRELGIERVVVLGGPAAVSDAVLRQLPAPLRVAGDDRVGTAIRIATDLWGYTAPGSSGERVLLANGFAPDAWAGALTAAPLSARNDAPLLLTGGDSALSPGTAQFLAGMGYGPGTEATGWVVGGGTAVSGWAAWQFGDLLR